MWSKEQLEKDLAEMMEMAENLSWSLEEAGHDESAVFCEGAVDCFKEAKAALKDNADKR